MAKTRDFTWSTKEYLMREIFDEVSTCFPVIVRVTQGFMGQDERMHTFSLHETYWLQEIHTQRRVLMKDEKGKAYSFPLDFGKRLKPIVNAVAQKERPLQEIVEDWKKTGEPIPLELPPGGIPVFAGLDSTFNLTLGVLHMDDVYDERYLIGHSVIDGVPYETPTLIPAYVDLKFEEAIGFVGSNKQDFLSYMDTTAETVTKFEYPVTSISGNKAIMMYDGDLDTRDYEYIVPTLASAQRRLSKYNAQPPKYLRAPSVEETGENTYDVITNEPSQGSIQSKLDGSKPKRFTNQKPNEAEYECITLSDDPKTAAPQRPPTRNKPSQKKKPAPTPSPKPAPAKKGVPSIPQEAPGAPSQTKQNQLEQNTYDQIQMLKPPQISTSTASKLNRSADGVVYASLAEVPETINHFTISEVSDVLRLLKLDKYVGSFSDNDIDGELLNCLDKDVLMQQFNMTQFESIKIMKFIGGWRPT